MDVQLDPNGFGQRWNPVRLRVIEQELVAFQPYVVLSGGWAWHFLTPPGHTEYVAAHDHEDADVVVLPQQVAPLMVLLTARGYERAQKGCVDPDSDIDLNRYTRVVNHHAEPVKVVLGIMVADVPHVEAGGFRVIEPSLLLADASRHGSRACLSARIARDLVARGEKVAGHPAMADYGRFLAGQ